MRGYNKFDRLLHDYALGNNFVPKCLFEIEKLLARPTAFSKSGRHVFICGLPRSGTTILLNSMNSDGSLASLTYAAMPFVTAPNTSKFLFKRNTAPKERYHGDNILFDINSPEAFDEIFFRSFGKEAYREFPIFLDIFLSSKSSQRYLSKNNNNYSRIGSLCEIFPNAVFILPFREPVNHAASLLKQHVNFSQLHKEDDFTRRYMRYLGHCEFGLDHKSWYEPIHHKNKSTLSYWLEQWQLYYEDLLLKYSGHERCIFVAYENLAFVDCVARLMQRLDVKPDGSVQFKIAPGYGSPSADRALIKSTKVLYEKLKKISIF